jgi:hypothetical protein
MPYDAEIRRGNPSLVIFLIDQSGSMDDPCEKAQDATKELNGLIANLVGRCVKVNGVWNLFYVSFLGYADEVRSLWKLSQDDLIPIATVANNPIRVEEKTQRVFDEAGGLQQMKIPIWFDVVANGSSSMCAAITRASEICESWIRQHPDSYPPTVINISDGSPTDGNPTNAAQRLKGVVGNDGGVLLWNKHISSSSRTEAVYYPESDAGLPDNSARLLYDISSILPEQHQNYLSNMGYSVSNKSRCFVSNGALLGALSHVPKYTMPLTGKLCSCSSKSCACQALLPLWAKFCDKCGHSQTEIMKEIHTENAGSKFTQRRICPVHKFGLSYDRSKNRYVCPMCEASRVA